MLDELLKSPAATFLFSAASVACPLSLLQVSVGLQSGEAGVLPLGDTVKHSPLFFALEIKQHVCLGCSKCNKTQQHSELLG